MYDIRNYEYDKYIPISGSQDSNNSNISSGGNSCSGNSIAVGSSIGSYGSNNGIPLPKPHYYQQVNYGSPPRHSSPLSNGGNVIPQLDKPPIHTLTLLSKECQDFYDIIIILSIVNANFGCLVKHIILVYIFFILVWN
jgi:hypothetical protein